MSGNNKDYILSVDEYIAIKNALSAIPEIRDDIKQIKEELAVKNHIVVDNSEKTDWKPIVAIIIAVIGFVGTVIAAIVGSR